MNRPICDKCGKEIICGEYGYAKYINNQDSGRATLCPDCIELLKVFLNIPIQKISEK